MEVSKLLEERGSRYGDFTAHAEITQALKQTMYAVEQYQDLPPYMQEALEMVAHKIGRILNGDPYYLDSWDDIQGYIKLVTDELRRNRCGV